MISGALYAVKPHLILMYIKVNMKFAFKGFYFVGLGFLFTCFYYFIVWLFAYW